MQSEKCESTVITRKTQTVTTMDPDIQTYKCKHTCAYFELKEISTFPVLHCFCACKYEKLNSQRLSKVYVRNRVNVTYIFRVIRRLVSLLSRNACLEAEKEAAMKQAQSASRAAETLMKGSDVDSELQEKLTKKESGNT